MKDFIQKLIHQRINNRELLKANGQPLYSDADLTYFRKLRPMLNL